MHFLAIIPLRQLARRIAFLRAIVALTTPNGRIHDTALRALDTARRFESLRRYGR